jgi:hypothetical protein
VNLCIYAVMFVFLSRDPSETAIPDITYYYNIRYNVVLLCGCVYYNILYGSDDRQQSTGRGVQVFSAAIVRDRAYIIIIIIYTF